MTRCVPAHNNNQANILVSNNLCACLADFGLSTMVNTEHHTAPNASSISVSSEGSLMSSTHGGPYRWMSPELIHPGWFGLTDRRPTKQSDYYALGMVVYEVCADVAVPAFPII